LIHLNFRSPFTYIIDFEIMEATMRSAVKLSFVGMIVFVIAFVLRWAFFFDVKPISWEDAPPPNGILQAAFLLLTIENVSAIAAALALIAAVTIWVRRTKLFSPQ
jgi:hypothetical protein